MASYSPNPIHLNRAQRRRLAAAAPAVDRITAADANFFERFPDRQHRLRLMGSAEHEQFVAAGGKDIAGPDEQWAVAVRQVVPGGRLRRFFTCRRDTDLDQPEAVARATFAHLSANDPRTAIIEQQVRTLMAQGANR